MYLIQFYKSLQQRTDVGYNEYEAEKRGQLVYIRCFNMLFRAFMNTFD